MIGRRFKTPEVEDVAESPKGFDDYALRLGDVMRGERATMGKSLLDVQRELRIKASYIAAIENCDPDAFETPGFIAGYVRSYARYLAMDPDATFAQFCAESGFAPSTGIDGAQGPRKKPETAAQAKSLTALDRDPFKNPSTPFSPARESIFAGIEPGAIGSMVVLVALIGALGFGGYSVLQEVQRVQLAPVEQTPVVLSELDPLSAATAPMSANAPAQGDDEVIAAARAGGGAFTPPETEGLDRLYRPQALDVPVLIARDAPISTLDPSQFGNFAGDLPAVSVDDDAPAVTRRASSTDLSIGTSGVQVVAVRPAWVRIEDANSGELFAGIMNAGDVFDVPAGSIDPAIEVGESGAVYFAAAGRTFGPAGPRGTVTEGLPLEAEILAAILPNADVQADSDLNRVLASLGQTETTIASNVPQVLDSTDKRVTVVATRTAWVRVRSAQGTVLYEGVMEAGDFYTVPATQSAPTIRTGDAGAIFFAAAGQTFGPYGSSGAIADNLALDVATIQDRFQPADVQQNAPLARAVAELNASLQRAGQ
ncbi:helix-turn-helix domain-containing protein [Primorskyibacter sp. S187A]|uniref:helix-turn-helix domain-containing protein n=1 Tax=Primorskyibacter sp. S187A TaxID=3415130 RepID=UPI003C7B4396